MKILMISYLPLEKEGRLNRCYNALIKEHNVYLIDTNSGSSAEHGTRVSIKLKNKSNIKNYLEFVKGTVIATQKVRFDLVYAHNFYAALPALIISKMSGKPLLYDAYELYYPAAKTSFSLRDKFFYYNEKRAIKFARQVICANKERSLIMTGHYDLRKLPVVVQNISHEVDPLLHSKSLTNDEEIRIVYAGYLVGDRKIIEFIDALKGNPYRKRIKFHIYGYGPLAKEIESLSSQHEYNFVEYCGSYNNSELGMLLVDYHIGYVSYPNNNFNNIFCCPNKIYDYANNGLAIIASYNEGLLSIVNKNEIGCCNENLSVAISDVIGKYEEYTSKLETFLSNNTWVKEEIELLKAVTVAVSN